ncbi:hypothetical protein PMAYCL1PPCAC_16616 [Pristionchus mayeri]|uniref:Sulfotransferase domain-containing protein n=1 Tax=Pristionchus mayeri TaxID=1317129 RepID=A0AAN5CL73_9BILA|nr:hypothetical protein PMAYCL1PPCAC_16616 [Pristionchus mayeri]
MKERIERLPPKHWAVFTPEKVSSAKSLRPRTDDIFVCTYAKSGTTWIQHIVHLLLGKTVYDELHTRNGSVNALSNGEKALFTVSPMIESFGASFVDAMESPRILKSHLSYADIPKGGGAKYIYACRNPKDCLTSFFHHHRNLKVFDFENGSFDLFFDLFMDGKVAVGDYFDHLNSWLEGISMQNEQILFLKYEDMVTDLRSAVIKIAEFIGGKALELVKDEQQLAKILDASSLESMKVNQSRWVPDKWQRGEFIRKGGSRNWKEHFSFEQSLRLDKLFRQRCGDTAAAEWWRSEMAWNDEQKLVSRPAEAVTYHASKL